MLMQRLAFIRESRALFVVKGRTEMSFAHRESKFSVNKLI